jgi:hypothetical protein
LLKNERNTLPLSTSFGLEWLACICVYTHYLITRLVYINAFYRQGCVSKSPCKSIPLSQSSLPSVKLTFMNDLAVPILFSKFRDSWDSGLSINSHIRDEQGLQKLQVAIAVHVHMCVV